MSEENLDRGDELPDNTPVDPPAADDPPKGDDAPKGGDAPKGDEAPKTDDPARDDKGRFIPQDRHKAILEGERLKRETAERQLQELRGQLAQVDRGADVAKLEEKLAELRTQDRKAIMAGDEAKSIELAAAIDKLNRQIVLQQSTDMSERSRELAREDIRVDMAIEKLEIAYPQLRDGDDAFDPELTNIVLAEQRRLIAEESMSPSKALLSAAEKVMKRMAEPTPAAKEEPKGLAAADKGTTRDAAAKAKKLDAMLKTPPGTQDVGLDTDKAGMKDGTPVPLTIADLAAIPEATLKRMRGDLA